MRKVFAILDIETVTEARLAFDVAWILCDSNGNVLGRYNYLVKEIIDTPFASMLLIHDSFMKDKSEMYIDAINNNGIEILSLGEISEVFHNSLYNEHGIRDNNVKLVMCAYNAYFDFSVLNDNMQNYAGIDFFESDVEIVDIMTMVLATICDTKKYVNWCINNNMTTAKGNVKTNAETVYGYLTNNVNYVEEHHALADCEIEKDIYFRARSYKKKMHTSFAWPVFHCKEWKKVQSNR